MLLLATAAPLGCGSGEANDADDDSTGWGPAGPAATDGSAQAGPGSGGAGGGTGGSSGAGASSVGGGSYGIDDVGDWHQQTLKTNILFAPHDDLEAHVLAHLGAAQQKIRLAFFNIRLAQVKTLLVQKKNAGVSVHVLLDKDQQDLPYNTMGAELQAAGVPVTLIDNTSATNATMHDKFAIIDDELVMTGSANYSYTALNVSDEDLITFESTSLAQRYQAEFDELIAHGNAQSPTYPSGTALQAWMGPEDSLWSKVKTALDGAQSHALVAVFDLNASALVTALVNAKNRGVKVVVVLDQLQADEPGATADETLTGAGIPVILAHNTGGMQAEMHSKFVVVDHQKVLLGSYNWTSLASYYNDENLVLIDDPHLAARVEGKYAQLLNDYPSPSPTALGLVTGSQQVGFSVSNVTLDPGLELTIQSLGGGPFAQPTPLTGDTVSANIAAGTRVTYRYAIRNQSSKVVEELGTHSFTVPYASGPFAVVDAFQKP